jgi:hypothetical protein
MLTSLDKFDHTAVVGCCALRAEISVALPPKRDSDPFCPASEKGRQQSIAGEGESLPGFAPTPLEAFERIASTSWRVRGRGRGYVSTFRGDSARAWDRDVSWDDLLTPKRPCRPGSSS